MASIQNSDEESDHVKLVRPSLASDLAAKAASTSQSSKDEQFGSLPLYRCKKCRRIVASQENVQAHDPQTGKSFKRKSKANVWDEEIPLICTSIFVEPMRWMSTVCEGDVTGKLSCGSCGARLGSFDWAGAQCSCGAWIVPAFQLHKSRIDISKQ